MPSKPPTITYINVSCNRLWTIRTLSYDGLRKIGEDEILDSLRRSGYLFESEITKTLSDFGFFVESNITSLDPLTGKNREIDLVAEYHREYDPEKAKAKVVAISRFVFEIKNNNSPFVLMTRFENSPHSEIYNGLKTAKTIPEKLKDVWFSDFFDLMFYSEPRKKLFTQYCSFSKKKNEELMAHHPDNIYSAFQKITHFCEEQVEPYNKSNYKDEYFRNFVYLPVLLIKEDLYELDYDEDDSPRLMKVESSQLVFNYHFKQKPKTAIIFVMTKAGLEPFLRDTLNFEVAVEKNMLESKELYIKKAEKNKMSS